MTLLNTTDIQQSFGGLVVLDGVSLAVEEGTIQGLIGPNGAGKTTFFNIVSGLITPDAGTVSYQGKDITGVAPKNIARAGIGRTFQITRPFPGLTVRDNLLPGLLYAADYEDIHDARRRADEILALVGLDELAAAEGRSLTMSEQKRLEMARALATEPDLLLLDEVFAGLSHEDIERQIELVRTIQSTLDVSILMIEHVMEATMRVCDRVGVLASGGIIAENVPEEIVHNQRVIDVYLGSNREHGGEANA